MVDFIISLGNINKKFLLIIIYIILYSLINIYSNCNIDDIVTLYLEGFGFSIAEIIIFFVFNIIKYTKYRGKSDSIMEKVSFNKYLKDYFFLFLIDCFYMVNDLITYYLEENTQKSNSSRQLYINDAIEIIFLILVTYFLLKYKYYIHHFISIAILVILYLSIDLLLGNFNKSNFLNFGENILYILTDLLIFSYIKYLIEFQYFYFMDIIFIMGVFEFLFYFVCFIIVIIINSVNGSNIIFLNFYNFYNDNGALKMIYRFLFEFIFIAPLIGINEVIIVKELTPNHNTIAYQLSVIFLSIIYSEGINSINRWLIIIIFIFQIIFLLFFLEILEYNFCSLNRNTKKSIMKREKNQSFDEKDNEIIIDGYDFTEGMKIKKEDIEMAMFDREKDEDY